MAAYTAYLPPDGDLERARFLADGRSLFALFLPAVFLIWHRLWYWLAVYILIAIAAGLSAHFVGQVAAGFLGALPGLFLFLHGRELVRGRLEREGWREAAAIAADDEAEAELRFYANPPAPQLAVVAPLAAVRPAAPSLVARPSFGMFPE